MTFAEQLEQRGLQKGLHQGEHQKALAIAQRLLSKGLDRQFILETTDLTEEDLDILPPLS